VIDAIIERVPRYRSAHPRRVLNALKKLETSNRYNIIIDRRQTVGAILFAVNQYAAIRDAEDDCEYDSDDEGEMQEILDENNCWGFWER